MGGCSAAQGTVLEHVVRDHVTHSYVCPVVHPKLTVSVQILRTAERAELFHVLWTEL